MSQQLHNQQEFNAGANKLIFKLNHLQFAVTKKSFLSQGLKFPPVSRDRNEWSDVEWFQTLVPTKYRKINRLSLANICYFGKLQTGQTIAAFYLNGVTTTFFLFHFFHDIPTLILILSLLMCGPNNSTSTSTKGDVKSCCGASCKCGSTCQCPSCNTTKL